LETGTVGGDVCFAAPPPVFFFLDFFFFFFAAAVPFAPGGGGSSSSPDSSSSGLSAFSASPFVPPFTAPVSFLLSDLHEGAHTFEVLDAVLDGVDVLVGGDCNHPSAAPTRTHNDRCWRGDSLAAKF
jgi:hypothetical protein